MCRGAIPTQFSAISWRLTIAMTRARRNFVDYTKRSNQENHKLADRIHRELAERWGVNDPALIRARGFMEE